MTKRTWMSLSTVLALAVGCGSKQSAPAKPPAEAAQQPAMCSMMKDAQLATTDGEHDVTITFTTQGDPTELRAHVHKMGAMHDQMSHGKMDGGMMGSGGMGSGGMHDGMHGGMHGEMHGEMHGGSGMMGGGMHEPMVPSHAAVDDVEHGARIVLTPDDPAQLASLRGHVHEHVEMMKSGHCPMMEGHEASEAPTAHHDMSHHDM